MAWGGQRKNWPVHAADIKFPSGGLKPFENFPVVACEIGQLADTPYECLIGRTMLEYWHLTYAGDGILEIKDLR